MFKMTYCCSLLLFSKFKNQSGSAFIVLIVLLAISCNSSAQNNQTGVVPPPTNQTGGGGVVTNDTEGEFNGHWALDPNKADSVTPNYEPYLKQECDYRMYVDFNAEVAENRESKSPYNKAVGKKYYDHPHAKPTKPKVMNPSHMCIRTDSEKNIDVNKFDCLPDILDPDQVAGFCGCGSRWSQIDLNDNSSYLGLDKETHSYEYFNFYGLDKFLIVQKAEHGDYECVAERFGHCTLEENMKKVQHVTNCRKGFKCRDTAIWRPVQRFPILNNNTGEWYGVCINEKTEDGLEDPYNYSMRRSSCDTAIITTLIIISLTYVKLVKNCLLTFSR